MNGIARSGEGESQVHRAGEKVRSRQRLKAAGKWAVGEVGCCLTRLLGSRAGGAVGILGYHRTMPWTDRGTAPTWNVTPRRFQRQIEGLLDRGYQAWPLRKVLDFHRAGRPIPPRTFVVTFDDGYECVYHWAWPILRALGVPATIFLATAYLDSGPPFPFDDWPSAGSPDVPAESWKPLTSAQCAEMLGQGLIDLGSHTHTHAVFRGRPDAMVQDIGTSLEVLHARFGLVDATFSFPFDIAGPTLIAAARRAGLLCSLSSAAVLVRPHSDPFTWGRFFVEESDTDSTLAAKLDGWFNLARGAWLRLRGTTADEVETSPV